MVSPALSHSCTLLAMQLALHPVPVGAAPPLGQLVGAGLPTAPGDARTLLLLSSSLPWVSLFCFSSHVPLHEGGESHAYPSG